MSVTIHPSTTSCGSDPEKLRERLDEIQLCETFNAEFSSGIESPRRTRLLERLRTALPAMRDCLLDLKAVVQGERSRYEQAVERMLAQHPELTPITDDVWDQIDPATAGVWDQIDPATAGVWDCCDALTYEGSRECECCGHWSIRTSSLEDVAGIMEELIHLLEPEE